MISKCLISPSNNFNVSIQFLVFVFGLVWISGGINTIEPKDSLVYFSLQLRCYLIGKFSIVRYLICCFRLNCIYRPLGLFESIAFLLRRLPLLLLLIYPKRNRFFLFFFAFTTKFNCIRQIDNNQIKSCVLCVCVRFGGFRVFRVTCRAFGIMNTSICRQTWNPVESIPKRTFKFHLNFNRHLTLELLKFAKKVP